eukprot:11729569-Alexandrium_andersonii.AAC.1
MKAPGPQLSRPAGDKRLERDGQAVRFGRGQKIEHARRRIPGAAEAAPGIRQLGVLHLFSPRLA